MSDVDALFGKQTRLALNHFAIGTETFPREFIRALGLVKRCAAQANIDCLQLEKISVWQ